MSAKNTLFESLYTDYHPMVLQMCLGFVKGDHDQANDLQQEVFINTWNALSKFKGKSGYKTWIYRITVNTCLKYIRDSKSKAQVALTESDQQTILKDDETDSLHQSLYKAIGQLNEVDRLIIMMVLDELTYDDMAEVIGISAGNLRVKIHRIKASLKKILKNE